MSRFLHILRAALILGLAGSYLAACATPNESNRLRSNDKTHGYMLGRWEGILLIDSATPDMLKWTRKQDPENTGIRIRIDIESVENPVLFLWYPDGNDWVEIRGDYTVVLNALGCIILVEQAQSRWIQKFAVTFDQLTKNESAITLTRTVHNTKIPANRVDIPRYYYVFASGKSTKSVNGVAPEN